MRVQWSDKTKGYVSPSRISVTSRQILPEFPLRRKATYRPVRRSIQLSDRNIQKLRTFSRSSIVDVSPESRDPADFAAAAVECSSHRPVTTAICKTQSRADDARFAYGQRFFSPIVYSIEERASTRTNGREVEGRRERVRRGANFWSERASE